MNDLKIFNVELARYLYVANFKDFSYNIIYKQAMLV